MAVYNCKCEDAYPRKTLAQMREFLMIRLGWAAMKNTPLPGVNDTLNSFLVDAQEQIYRQYKVFRLERFFTWPMVAGERFYDFPENEDVCTKKLDPRMVTWVGMSQDDTSWSPLVCGIRPTMYTGQVESIPTHYEIRQCIELWPAPADAAWKLRIKGAFGPAELALGADVLTVDPEAVFLQALANAKAHYSQPDAGNYAAQATAYVRSRVAESHQTRRYVPGACVPPPAVRPASAGDWPES